MENSIEFCNISPFIMLIYFYHHALPYTREKCSFWILMMMHISHNSFCEKLQSYGKWETRRQTYAKSLWNNVAWNETVNVPQTTVCSYRPLKRQKSTFLTRKSRLCSKTVKLNSPKTTTSINYYVLFLDRQNIQAFSIFIFSTRLST